MSLGGTNCLGQPFNKEIALKRGQLQALWVGVAVPVGAQGVFTGTAQLRAGPDAAVPISITLRVDGAPLTDSGDAEAKNLSRLR
jgi:hypothetical protein